ncbi:hypothetical protein [Ureaplasma canigenitalium]|uniref:hypothetical protein n=1 Tax=Ureaplasma canigenitalium TaxID=42092 RepID=UPI0004E1EFD4|nr:hypothetical protein [Ureaplasma canigenitalium]
MIQNEKIKKLLRCSLEIIFINIVLVLILSLALKDIKVKTIDPKFSPDTQFTLISYWGFFPLGYYYLVFFAFIAILLLSFMIKNYVTYKEQHQIYFVITILSLLILIYLITIISYVGSPIYVYQTPLYVRHSVGKIFITLLSITPVVFTMIVYCIVSSILKKHNSKKRNPVHHQGSFLTLK